MIIPSAFCIDTHHVNAIVLGADPTNFSDRKQRKELTKAFGIGDGDPRYFRDILKNLESVGLVLNDLYITNCVKEYLKEQTSQNNEWHSKASKSLPDLIKELDAFDKQRKIPVFLTAQKIYEFLVFERAKSAKEIYSKPELIPINREANKLGRRLIPMFRHYGYQLQNWSEYRDRIKEILA